MVSYACQSCGVAVAFQTARCPDCGVWGSVAFDPDQASRGAHPEFLVEPAYLKEEGLVSGDGDDEPGEFDEDLDGEGEAIDPDLRRAEMDGEESEGPLAVSDIEYTEAIRIPSGLEGFDRVTCGGFARRITFLLSGKPGAGKSTLLFQALSEPAERGMRCLYLGGEMKNPEMAGMCKRVGGSPKIQVYHERNLPRALEVASRGYDVVAIDSAQAMEDPRVTGQAGGITQVKNVGLRATEFAQAADAAVILLAHVDKKGKIAGPNHLVHFVDAHFRMLRFRESRRGFSCPEKNRVGRTPQIWRCKMNEVGKIVDAEAEHRERVELEKIAKIEIGPRMRRQKDFYGDD